MELVPAQVLQQANLAEDTFSRQQASLTTEEYFRLWHVIEEALGSQIFPLQAIKAMFEGEYIPPIFATLCCTNFAQALQRLNEFKPLCGPMRLQIDVQDKQTTVYPALFDAIHKLPQSMALAELLVVTLVARKGLGELITPINITMPRKIDSLETYADFFGITPTLGEKLSISFSKADMERPFVSRDDILFESYTADFRERISLLQNDVGFASQVRGILLELLPSGVSSTVAVANRLAVSTRTLQRRLQQENTNFQNELGQTRIGLAKHYLSQTLIPNQQIGFLLGFTDPNSFYRLFQSTLGLTPEAYRQSKQ
jgi:AraC-like DNA-binding protein